MDLTQGTIEIFGEAGTSYAVHAADVNGSGEYKPGSVTVHGPAISLELAPWCPST
ncbi:hypothetical protein [Gordonia westfalica]|uniref:hypothetical protein n=1 Tax=Gordonia westfalica TaxID=158898 RepID=UPI00135670C1|nr:hypothetical protein [Gordonia westfalica]